MWEAILTILGKKSFDAAISAVSESGKSKGQVANLLDELKTNSMRCKLVLGNNADPREEGKRLSRSVYLALRDLGYDFAKIKKGTIPAYDFVNRTDVAFLSGKTLAVALTNISDRIREINIICESSAPLERIDLKRRFGNLAKRLAVVGRFISSR